MNKVISSVLSVLSFLVSISFLLSFLLTTEKSLKFLLNLNQSSQVDFVLSDSHWHPFNPSIEIDDLSVKGIQENITFIEINGLKMSFNLFTAFHSNLIENFYAEQMNLSVDSSFGDEKRNLNELWVDISTIKNLTIKEFSLKDYNNRLSTLQGNLSLTTLKSGTYKVKFYARSEVGGDVEFRMYSIEGSKSLKDYKGFLNTSNFYIDEGAISQFCSSCPSITLDSKAWFTLIDLKLVKFSGNANFNFLSKMDYIDSITAKVELEDTKNNIFKISSVLNSNPKNRIPVMYASLNTEEILFFIPEIVIGKDELFSRFQHILNLPKDVLLKGNINNVILNISNSLKFNADFKEFSFESEKYAISGLEGKLQHTRDLTRLTLNTPFLQIDLGSLFDNPLIFNDLTSTMDLTMIDKKVSILNSSLRATHKKNSIKGEINLFPSPYDDTGDLSIKFTSNKLNYLDALNLFPNLNYTNSIKSWLKNSITCGSLEEISFIYRGSVDNKYEDSSSSFQSKGLFSESCLNINNVGIKNIDLLLNINNSSFFGQVLDGDLYGSTIQGHVKTYKENGRYKLDLEGNSKGPFSSILRLSNLNKIFEAKSNDRGEQNTDFSFSSPLVSDLNLLGNATELKLKTKIKDANFVNKKTRLDFTNLFSLIEYDSSNGVKDGFATLKINNIPIKFDIKKGSEKGSFNTLLVAEDTFSFEKIFNSFAYGNEITGSSKFNIRLTLPSYIKGHSYIDPQIEVNSNLAGININLPKPLNKTKDTKINFNLVFKPYLDEPSILNFKYGNLFRGKIRFLNELAEGFIIAGKKKQSISILDEKIYLVGELKNLDLGSYLSSDIFNEQGPKNFFIKDLLVKETNFSNFSLFETRFSSYNTKEGIEYKFINDELNGILLVPENKDEYLSFRFDYIRLKKSSSVSKDSFLSLYNSIDQEFGFSVDAIFLEGHNYGNWEFLLSPGNNQLRLSNIKGTYGRWDFKKNSQGISVLEISKNPIGWTSNLKTNIYSGSPEKAFMQIGIKPNFELDTLSLDADLTWNNLPWLFSYNSVNGEIATDLSGLTIENNEELDTTNNLLRLVSIFNITDSFEKVTNLNFRKLYKRGFSVDKVKGKFRISDKSLQIKEPILLKSGSSQFSWTGYISRDKTGNLDLLNLEVIMTLPLREYLPAYALVLGGPITAGVVYIAGKAFERNLDKISSGKWIINGHISEPKTEFEGWFEDSSD